MFEAEIYSIKIFKKNSPPFLQVKSAVCSLDLGLEGDRFAKGGNRQITIIDLKTYSTIKTQKAQGLCFERYDANLVVKNGDTSLLKLGETLSCDDAQFLVTEQKECFEQCNLRQNNIKCPLKSAAKFLKVTKSGSINIGDTIKSKL